MDKLTDREVDVLKMILDGYNSQEIGEKIFRSERTVHDIRENIRGKLGLFTVKRSEFFRTGREYLKTLDIKSTNTTIESLEDLKLDLLRLDRRGCGVDPMYLIGRIDEIQATVNIQN